MAIGMVLATAAILLLGWEVRRVLTWIVVAALLAVVLTHDSDGCIADVRTSPRSGLFGVGQPAAGRAQQGHRQAGPTGPGQDRQYWLQLARPGR